MGHFCSIFQLATSECGWFPKRTVVGKSILALLSAYQEYLLTLKVVKNAWPPTARKRTIASWLNQEKIKVNEWALHIGLIPKIINLKVFSDTHLVLPKMPLKRDYLGCKTSLGIHAVSNLDLLLNWTEWAKTLKSLPWFRLTILWGVFQQMPVMQQSAFFILFFGNRRYLFNC